MVGFPLLVVVVALAQRTWYPTGDLAQAELRMRSMPGDVPLVGAAGRIADDQGNQGNHPGPLMFWVTWPLYAVLGRSAWAFQAATALVNVAWLTASVLLVARRAGAAVVAGYGLVALVLIGGFGLDAVSQPWNPWVALLPFLVLLLAVWSTLDGDRWAPVVAVAGGSYAMQSHVGYAPLVGPLVLVALAWPVWRHLREPTPVGAGARWWTPPIVAVVVGLAAWSGPLVDLATNDPHNVEKLIANFGSPSEDPVGAQRGLEAHLRSAAPFGSWVAGGEELAGSVVPGAVLLAAWAASAVVVARSGRRPSLTRLNAVLALTTVLGVVALSRVFGTLYLYVFRWVTVLVALQVFALGWAVATWLPRPSADLARRLVAVVVVSLVAGSALTAARLAGQETPYSQSWRIEQQVAPEVAAALDPDLQYLVTWDDVAYLGGIGFGLVLDLERRGFDVGTPPRFAAAVEPHRVRCPDDYDVEVTAVTGRAAIDRWEAMDDASRLVLVDLRDDPAEYDANVERLRAALAADGNEVTAAEAEARFNLILLAPGQSRAVVEVATELIANGVPTAVYRRDAPANPTGTGACGG